MHVINVINVHFDGREAMHTLKNKGSLLASMVQQRPLPSIEPFHSTKGYLQWEKKVIWIIKMFFTLRKNVILGTVH